MYHLSHRDWPRAHACTYVVWNFHQSAARDCHDHDYFELFWVESGRGCHEVNGARRLMETGYLALVRPEDAHSFSAWQSGDSVRFINFAFRPGIWEAVRNAFFPGRPRFFGRKALEEREFHIGSDDRERLRLMAADLAAGRWTAVNAAAFLHGILALLANRKGRNLRDPLLPDWLAHALRSIETWPHFTGGVGEFVRLAGRSHEHVTRDCRRLLGTTPRHLVNNARLKWAAMQLETTEKKIVDVAQECGFDNLGHFYKLFQAAHHLTPRRYRLRFGIRKRE